MKPWDHASAPQQQQEWTLEDENRQSSARSVQQTSIEEKNNFEIPVERARRF